jgi:hypothetical protein
MQASDFENGLLIAPIDATADGKVYMNAATKVWTGAKKPSEVGTAATTCSDWRGGGTSIGGFVGDNWTSAKLAWFYSGSIRCEEKDQHLLCIEP